MGVPSSSQVDLVRYAGFAAVAVVAVLIAVSLGGDLDSPGSIAASRGWIVICVIAGAVPFLPLLLRGVAFRISAAAVGLFLFAFGFALLLAGIGMVLIIAGFVDLLAAFLPAGKTGRADA